MKNFKEYINKIKNENDIENMSLYQMALWANKENLGKIALDVRHSCRPARKM